MITTVSHVLPMRLTVRVAGMKACVDERAKPLLSTPLAGWHGRAYLFWVTLGNTDFLTTNLFPTGGDLIEFLSGHSVL